MFEFRIKGLGDPGVSVVPLDALEPLFKHHANGVAHGQVPVIADSREFLYEFVLETNTDQVGAPRAAGLRAGLEILGR